jgi:hypothetical protein
MKTLDSKELSRRIWEAAMERHGVRAGLRKELPPKQEQEQPVGKLAPLAPVSAEDAAECQSVLCGPPRPSSDTPAFVVVPVVEARPGDLPDPSISSQAPDHTEQIESAIALPDCFSGEEAQGADIAPTATDSAPAAMGEFVVGRIPSATETINQNSYAITITGNSGPSSTHLAVEVQDDGNGLNLRAKARGFSARIDNLVEHPIIRPAFDEPPLVRDAASEGGEARQAKSNTPIFPFIGAALFLLGLAVVASFVIGKASAPPASPIAHTDSNIPAATLLPTLPKAKATNDALAVADPAPIASVAVAADEPGVSREREDDAKSASKPDERKRNSEKRARNKPAGAASNLAPVTMPAMPADPAAQLGRPEQGATVKPVAYAPAPPATAVHRQPPLSLKEIAPVGDGKAVAWFSDVAGREVAIKEGEHLPSGELVARINPSKGSVTLSQDGVSTMWFVEK